MFSFKDRKEDDRRSTASPATTSPPTARRSSTSSRDDLRHRRRPAGTEAGRRQARPGEADPPHPAPRGVAPGVRGRLENLPRLVLRSQPPWRGLAGHPGPLRPDAPLHVQPRPTSTTCSARSAPRSRSATPTCSRGNAPGPARVEGALLGAEIVADPSGYFRVDHIFPGENWHADFRSPLTEPGVHVETGDYILAVDGQTTKGVDNFYRLLEGKADRVLTLLVNGKPTPQGAREERVRPVDSEQNLRYLDWVQTSRAKVDKLSGGRIGYIHLPDTAPSRQPRAVQVLLSAGQQGRPDLRRPLQRRRLHPRPDDRPDLPALAELLRRPLRRRQSDAAASPTPDPRSP